MKDFKYLGAYLVPFLALAGIHFGGMWSPALLVFIFILVPVLEMILPKSKENFDEETEQDKAKSKFFDFLLYFNIPLLYGTIFYLYYTVSTVALSVPELMGMMFSVGVLVAALGLNVGHELGHRSNRFDQFCCKVLYLPALYLHFFIEHNRGHHKHVATDLDPASSKRGQILYFFWIQSMIGGFASAWKIETSTLKRKGQKVWSLQNEMIRFQFIQIAYLLAVGFVFGWQIVPVAIGIGIIGILLLETINYVEHYGLRRKKLENGRYEPVQPHHSWNSNHEMGRILLYELTRHSDHHFKANRKFQVLRHFEESPQLPYGYPSSVLMAFVPPLWFHVMDKEVAKYSDDLPLNLANA